MKIDISNLLLNQENSIKQAIACIDRGRYGIAIVVDQNKRLLGTITDGDVRRALLKGDSIDAPLKVILERKSTSIYPKPITVTSNINKETILEIMRNNAIRQIPIIDECNRVIDLVTIDELLPDQKRSLQAVVLSGGETTRLHPMVADLPKTMLPVGNKPLMEFTINQLQEAGFEQVSLTTHYKAEAVRKHFGDGGNFGVKISYLDENDTSGTAGALKMIPHSTSPLLVINGDVLTRVNFSAMLEYHLEQQADMTVAVKMNEFRIPYGIIDTKDGRITDITEKPTFSHFINAGAYILNPDIPGEIPINQHYDMPDLINLLIRAGKKVISFPVYEYWRDIQVFEDYQQVMTDFRNGLFSDFSSAIAGMEPGMPTPPSVIPLSVPEIRGNEWVYIKECLDTNWVSSVGPFVDRFEESVANYTGRKYGVAASTGTAAIHTSLLIAGVQSDDEVLLSDLTFIAPANAVRYVNAWPVFIDVDPIYWQMDPQKLAVFIKNDCFFENNKLYNRKSGRHISAIIPVHLLGHPCDMDPILELAHKHNLIVIEDATESLGSKYKDKMVGNLGDIACFSFNGNKIITTGGGGMIVTDNEQWAKRAKYLTTQAKDDPIEFVHGSVGFNYRLTNIQAAMGCAQMEQLNQYVKIKRDIANRYRIGLSNIPGITLMNQAEWAYSTYWLYTILINPNEFGMNRRQLLSHLGSNGIQVRPLWQPLHKSPVFSSQSPQKCVISEYLQENAISLPCSVGLSISEQEKVIEVIIKSSRR